MIVNSIASGDDQEWDHYVSHHPAATHYHLSGWRLIIEQVFGHQAHYLLAKSPNASIAGVLPLIHISSVLFGRFLVSMPFVNYGGVLANDIAAERALLDAAVNLARDLGTSYVELRHIEQLASDWPSRQHKVSMCLQLPPEFEVLWTGFPSKLRSQIRRAQKENMNVRFGGVELLDDFYNVFSRNMRDLGTPVYGRNFFLKILEQFQLSAHVAVVSTGACPLAVGFLCGFRETLEIVWASADRRYNHLSPNMLLYRSVLQFACEKGYRRFDFGRSTPNGGTYRFKQQWGAVPVPLRWYYWSRDDRPTPDLSPQNQKFRVAIALWRHMPLFLSRLIGPRIVKFIP